MLPASQDTNCDQVAVLTCGADSIMIATALRLARRGYRIVTSDGNRAALQRLEQQFQREGLGLVGVEADIDDPAMAGKLVDAAVGRFGRLDVLINGPLGIETDLDQQRAHFFLKNWLHTLRAATPALEATGGGRIVNVVSSAGRYRSAYFQYEDILQRPVADAGLNGAILAMTRQSAFELAIKKIRINAVVLGWIEKHPTSPKWDNLSVQDRGFVLEEISLGRLGRPDEVAAVIQFLASSASSYITGTAIDVNGGWWMS